MFRMNKEIKLYLFVYSSQVKVMRYLTGTILSVPLHKYKAGQSNFACCDHCLVFGSLLEGHRCNTRLCI